MAAMPTIIAMTASTVSNALTVRGAAAEALPGAGAGALAGAGAGGRDTAVPGRVAVAAAAVGAAAGAGRGICVVGTGPAGRAAPGAAVAGAGAAVGAAPVGGSDGNLIVGAAVGFGGNAMRTVSFFGCTFAASAGLGGTPPIGDCNGSGVGSAINRLCDKLEAGKKGVKSLIPVKRR